MDVYNIQTAEAQAYPKGHVELTALARATQAAGTHYLKTRRDTQAYFVPGLLADNLTSCVLRG